MRQHHGAVIRVRRIKLERAGAELGVIAPFPGFAARHLAQRGAAFGAGDASNGFTRELAQFRCADAIAAHQRGLDAQLAHLANQRAGLGIHAAVENDVRLRSLDLGQNGGEVGGFVVGVLAIHQFHAVFLGRLGEHVGHALTVGGTIIDHGDGLGFQRVLGIVGQTCAQRAVVGDDAEEGLETLLRNLGIGGRRSDVGDAGVVVNARSGEGAAGVQVADDAIDLFINEFLRHGGGLFRVGLVVLGIDLPLDLFAADDDVLRVQIFDGHFHAVGVVLAEAGLRARQGRCATDGDGDGVRSVGGANGHGQGQQRSDVFQFHE